MSAIPSTLPQNVAAPTAPSTQVKAAQAAFFRAALSEAQATAPRATPPNLAVSEAESARPPRPGQLLDIRV